MQKPPQDLDQSAIVVPIVPQATVDLNSPVVSEPASDP